MDGPLLSSYAIVTLDPFIWRSPCAPFLRKCMVNCNAPLIPWPFTSLHHSCRNSTRQSHSPVESVEWAHPTLFPPFLLSSHFHTMRLGTTISMRQCLGRTNYYQVSQEMGNRTVMIVPHPVIGQLISIRLAAWCGCTTQYEGLPSTCYWLFERILCFQLDAPGNVSRLLFIKVVIHYTVSNNLPSTSTF